MDLLTTAAKLGIEGFMHCDELEKLAELAANRDVLEVGSFKGLTAWTMALVARSLWCVDTFKANSAGQQQMEAHTTLEDFRRAISRFNHVRYFAGTSEEASLNAGSPRLPSEQFDLIFLDAMHTYEDVKSDINRWWPRVKAGGIMAFHDYGHWDFPGVKKAVDEVFGAQSHVVVTLMWMQK